MAYAFDAWGKPIGCTGALAETLGRENPFRYRGYVYDEETGLYYLRSRYYNPEWGRFISMDGIMGDRGQLLSHHLFAYCQNNPMTFIDPDGFAAEEYYAFKPGEKEALRAKRAVEKHSSANKYGSNTVTVSEFIENLDRMVQNKTDVREKNPDGTPRETGCASYIAKALPKGASYIGMTSIFFGNPSSQDPETNLAEQKYKANAILWGEIDDIGGVDGLIKGMVVGERADDQTTVKHGGVYAGNGMVYSFNGVNGYASYRPYQPWEWDIYAWHGAVVLD